MPYRLLHTADLHLEAPFVGAGPAPREVTRRLAGAGLDTFDRVAALALERRVDAVLIAGGLFSSAPPMPATAGRVRAALESLHAGGVATVLVGQPGERL